jgi:hypothetical protein
MSIPDAPPALPDLLRFNDGSFVRTPNDWARRRSEVAEAIIPLQYGHMPPAVGVRAELLNSSVVKRFLGARFVQYRLTVEGERGSTSFILELTIPPGDGP